MSPPDSTITGAQLVAQTLKHHGITTVFGIIGIPVIEVGQACIDIGVRFVAFRNEQSAAYAACAYGYLTGRPGVLLVVGGPGVVHAMAGVFHAQTNAWPLLVLAGSSESFQQGMGAFQELDQVAFLKPHVKFAARPPTLHQLPYTIEKALRTAFYGKPGATYVDLPADYIQGSVQTDQLIKLPPIQAPPRTPAGDIEITRAVSLLLSAKRPLLVIGKGAQYARAEESVHSFLRALPIPFLPTPMGKGLMPDTHPLCISAARSAALAGADVVLVVGARLNWILHYGHQPKWSSNVKFIRIEIEPEAVDDNVKAEIALVGDAQAIMRQLTTALAQQGYQDDNSLQGRRPDSLDSDIKLKNTEHTAWYQSLLAKCHANSQNMIQKSVIFPQIPSLKPYDPPKPLKYHQAFALIKRHIPEDHIFIGEGANTLDIARSMFDVYQPRSRLDPGTQATMGVGMGLAIAAGVLTQHEVELGQRTSRRKVVAVVGDSAFGFSAMEVETAVRNKLGMLIVVMNNGGVYKGLSAKQYAKLPMKSLPPTALLPEVKYEQLATLCGGHGVLARTPEELVQGVISGLANQDQGVVTIVNLLMEPGGQKKLEFGWLASTKKEKSKL
ncbi:hypothetical protein QFC21_000156 [Naganishia friedmannii]|uniref:Uncharacterized protein n=1 Tax=Naganishia friedmannii TaxID=89922 RepID=A0ACC2WD96_9TREE|nr:hypothetical protein QFC21_000156 [Naganishia friedmannii]